MNRSKLADTHRHLGGSIAPEFVWDIISKEHHYSYLAETLDDVINQMTYRNVVLDQQKYHFQYFLSKFKILDGIEWTEPLIASTIKHVCEELQHEGVYGVLMDFSVNKYMCVGWHKHEAVKFIKDRFDEYSNGIKVGLILSVKYENTASALKQHIRSIEHPDVFDNVVGIDLVGDEHFYNPKIIAEHLYDWVAAGKLVRAHVGEVGGEENIESAINDLQVTNIAHGIKITKSPRLITLAKEKGIQFDLGLTSNIYTGIATITKHPVAEMILNGLNITIGTDDPMIFGTDLYNEFAVLEKMLRHSSLQLHVAKDQLTPVISQYIEKVRKAGVDSIRKWVK